MTHYEVLGIDERAAAVEIRQAYVRLARRHHPDFFSSADGATRAEAERRMQAINEAWDVLGDARRRLAYDRARGIVARPGADHEPRGFRPFDTGEEDVDPRDLPDEPYHRGAGAGGPLARIATLAPVLAFVAAVVLATVGLVIQSAGFLALGVASFLAACLGFVVIPLLALSRASRND